jgi:uncharacterized protein YhfF
MAFGSVGASREALNAFVLDAHKRATGRLVEFGYEAHGEPGDHVGERLAMLDSSGTCVATLVVTRAEVLRFADVPDEFAIVEGEATLPILVTSRDSVEPRKGSVQAPERSPAP